MTNDWIIDVLADLRDFAGKNDLPEGWRLNSRARPLWPPRKSRRPKPGGRRRSEGTLGMLDGFFDRMESAARAG